MPFAAIWMGLEILIMSKVRQVSYDITYIYIWNLKNGTNEVIYKIDIVTDVENKIMVNGESGLGEGISLEIGIDLHTPPYVTNKDLLHFTAQGHLLNTL